MDATTAQPTLLSAARNFIRKSAGTAVLTIAPLAAVALASEAKAQTAVFNVPSGISGFFLSGGTNYSAGSSGYFSAATPLLGNITGNKQGLNFNLLFLPGAGSAYSGGGSVQFGSAGFTGMISGGTNIPIAWDFNVSTSGSVVLNHYSIYLTIGDFATSDPNVLVFDSGFGNFSGNISGNSSSFATSNTYDGSNGGSAYLQLYINFSSADGTAGDILNITMNPASQGLALNATSLAAVPEPSVYAAIFGLGALGFAGLRRARRCAA